MHSRNLSSSCLKHPWFDQKMWVGLSELIRELYINEEETTLWWFSLHILLVLESNYAVLNYIWSFSSSLLFKWIGFSVSYFLFILFFFFGRGVWILQIFFFTEPFSQCFQNILALPNRLRSILQERKGGCNLVRSLEVSVISWILKKGESKQANNQSTTKHNCNKPSVRGLSQFLLGLEDPTKSKFKVSNLLDKEIHKGS